MNLSVEESALSDPRFSVLGTLLVGETAEPQAIGMHYAMKVWGWCYRECRYLIPKTFIDAIRPGLGDAMVRASLATEKCDHFRIHGTKGRIEWFKKLRESNRIRKQRSRVRHAAVTRDNPGPLTLTPTLTPTQEETTNTVSNSPSGNLDALARVKPKPRNGHDPTRTAELTRWFGIFYEDYPRHEGKQAAFKAFVKLNPDKDTMRAIGKDMDTRREDGRWLPDDPERCKFIPLPATYLNGKRWEDNQIA